MATFEQEQQAKQTLTSILEELSNIQAKDLIRADELGKAFSFESGVPIFERTLRLFHDLHQSNLDNVSFNVLNNLQNRANDARSKFKQIQAFSPQQQTQNPIGTRDSLINSLRDQYDDYFQIISPVIAYSIRKGTDFETLEKNAHKIVGTLETMKQDYSNTQSQIIKDMESTLRKVRQAAAEVGVSQHATHFREEASTHNEQSKKWLYATIVAACATIVWGIASFFIHPPNETAQIIQFTVAKLIILSALYYALVWCARNYNAHRHNYVVNKHRQNSLSTFETFVKATGNDTDTKNAVLLQATQSIFSAQSSGYVHKESDSETPNKFIEIMRSASSTVHKS